MKPIPRLSAALVFTLALAPQAAHADPIAVTSGVVSVTGIGASAQVHLTAPAFDLSGIIEPGVVGPDLACFPCAPGDAIPLGSFFAGTMGLVTATVDGTTYPLPTLTLSGSMTLSAPTRTAPSSAGAFTFTSPFTFDAHLIGSVDFNAPTEHVVFERLLSGQGTVTATFTAQPTDDGQPLFSFSAVRYDFENTAATPEPASLLMVATGALAFARGARRQARKR